MKHLFPPLLPKEALQPPVVALAAHPDDEVIGCGAMLAWHRSVGHPVTVVHMTDGAAGDPEGRHGDIAAQRRSEGREALGRLGVTDVRSIGLPDGELPEHFDAVRDSIRDAVTELAPQTVYGFFFTEAHRDHRAMSHALAAEAGALMPSCRVLLFGVNQVVVGGAMFDVTDFMAQKEQALSAYTSQLGYNDFVQKIVQRDHGATLNIEDPAVQHVELFADLRPEQLVRVRDEAEGWFRYLLGDAE